MLVDGVEDHAGVVGPGTIRYRAPRHRARISNMRLRQRHKIIKAGTGPLIASPDLYGPLLVETMLQLREASQDARCDRRNVSQRARFMKMQDSDVLVDVQTVTIQTTF